MGGESRKNLSGELEFEWTPERPARLSGGSVLQGQQVRSLDREVAEVLLEEAGGEHTEGSGETGAWGQQERTGSGQGC